MSTTTIGIKEALIEYLQDHVLNKQLTKRQVDKIEKLFEKHSKDDKIDKAIEWCDKSIKNYESFVLTSSGENSLKIFQSVKQYLTTIK